MAVNGGGAGGTMDKKGHITAALFDEIIMHDRCEAAADISTPSTSKAKPFGVPLSGVNGIHSSTYISTDSGAMLNNRTRRNYIKYESTAASCNGYNNNAGPFGLNSNGSGISRSNSKCEMNSQNHLNINVSNYDFESKNITTHNNHNATSYDMISPPLLMSASDDHNFQFPNLIDDFSGEKFADLAEYLQVASASFADDENCVESCQASTSEAGVTNNVVDYNQGGNGQNYQSISSSNVDGNLCYGDNHWPTHTMSGAQTTTGIASSTSSSGRATSPSCEQEQYQQQASLLGSSCSSLAVLNDMQVSNAASIASAAPPGAFSSMNMHSCSPTIMTTTSNPSRSTTAASALNLSQLGLQVVNGQLVVQAQLQQVQTANGPITVAVLPAGLQLPGGLTIGQQQPLPTTCSNGGSATPSPGLQLSVGKKILPRAAASSSVSRKKGGSNQAGSSARNNGNHTAGNSEQHAPKPLLRRAEPQEMRLSPEEARRVNELSAKINQLKSAENLGDVTVSADIVALEKERAEIFAVALKSLQFSSIAPVASPRPPRSRNKPSKVDRQGRQQITSSPSITTTGIEFTAKNVSNTHIAPASSISSHTAAQPVKWPVEEEPSVQQQHPYYVDSFPPHDQVLAFSHDGVPQPPPPDLPTDRIVEESERQEAREDIKRRFFERRKERLSKTFGAERNSLSKVDTVTPFRNTDDAMIRLLPFHVYHEPDFNEDCLEECDLIIGQRFERLNRWKSQLENRFRASLLRETMNPFNVKTEISLLSYLLSRHEQDLLARDQDLAAIDNGKFVRHSPYCQRLLSTEEQGAAETVSAPAVVSPSSSMSPPVADTTSALTTPTKSLHESIRSPTPKKSPRLAEEHKQSNLWSSATSTADTVAVSLPEPASSTNNNLLIKPSLSPVLKSPVMSEKNLADCSILERVAADSEIGSLAPALQSKKNATQSLVIDYPSDDDESPVPSPELNGVPVVLQRNAENVLSKISAHNQNTTPSKSASTSSQSDAPDVKMVNKDKSPNSAATKLDNAQKLEQLSPSSHGDRHFVNFEIANFDSTITVPETKAKEEQPATETRLIDTKTSPRTSMSNRNRPFKIKFAPVPSRTALLPGLSTTNIPALDKVATTTKLLTPTEPENRPRLRLKISCSGQRSPSFVTLASSGEGSSSVVSLAASVEGSSSTVTLAPSIEGSSSTVTLASSVEGSSSIVTLASSVEVSAASQATFTTASISSADDDNLLSVYSKEGTKSVAHSSSSPARSPLKLRIPRHLHKKKRKKHLLQGERDDAAHKKKEQHHHQQQQETKAATCSSETDSTTTTVIQTTSTGLRLKIRMCGDKFTVEPEEPVKIQQQPPLRIKLKIPKLKLKPEQPSDPVGVSPATSTTAGLEPSDSESDSVHATDSNFLSQYLQKFESTPPKQPKGKTSGRILERNVIKMDPVQFSPPVGGQSGDEAEVETKRLRLTTESLLDRLAMETGCASSTPSCLSLQKTTAQHIQQSNAVGGLESSDSE